MVAVSAHSLIVTSHPNPSILVLCPDEDMASEGPCRLLPILIGSQEATLLGIAMKGQQPNRPTTHDLFMNAIANLDALVDHVIITDSQGKIFYSTLALSCHGRMIELDARPSDAISLAIRHNAPIFVSKNLLDRKAIPFVFRNEKKDQSEIDEFHSFLQDLNPDDFLADEGQSE